MMMILCVCFVSVERKCVNVSLYICIYFGACDFAVGVCVIVCCLLLFILRISCFDSMDFARGFCFSWLARELVCAKRRHGNSRWIERSFYIFELFLLLLLFSFLFLCVYCFIYKCCATSVVILCIRVAVVVVAR